MPARFSPRDLVFFSSFFSFVLRCTALLISDAHEFLHSRTNTQTQRCGTKNGDECGSPAALSGPPQIIIGKAGTERIRDTIISLCLKRLPRAQAPDGRAVYVGCGLLCTKKSEQFPIFYTLHMEKQMNFSNTQELI